LARTGTTGSHFSGDIFLAFSTGNSGTLSAGYSDRRSVGSYDSAAHIPWANINPFLAAVVSCVEEAVVNTLVAAETMVGRNGFECPALPIDRTLALLGRS